MSRLQISRRRENLRVVAACGPWRLLVELASGWDAFDREIEVERVR